jgi:hypothetical protein
VLMSKFKNLKDSVTHNLIWSPSKCQKIINSNQRIIWLSYMHVYLIFDQAFGNEQKEKIFWYIVLCRVAPKHQFHEIYCVELFKFHVDKLFFGVIIWKDFKKHQEICFDYFSYSWTLSQGLYMIYPLCF